MRAASIFCAVTLLLLSGCASMGPGTIARDRFDYTTALSDSWKSQMLINAVKLQPPNPEVGSFVALIAKSLNFAIEHPDAPMKVGSTLPDLAQLQASDPERLGYYYQPDEKNPL